MNFESDEQDSWIDVVRNLSDLDDGEVTLTVPGSTVTVTDLTDLLKRSYDLSHDGLASLLYEELSEILEAEVVGKSVSEQLGCIKTSELLALLGQLKDALSAIELSAPGKQSELEAFRKELDDLIRDWNTFLASDFSDEQRVCLITVEVLGPTSKVGEFESAVRSAIDTAMLKAIKDLPVGIAGNGRPFILDLEWPEHLDTALYGEALQQRCKELGVPLMSQSVVDTFFSDLVTEWSTTEDEEPDEQ